MSRPKNCSIAFLLFLCAIEDGLAKPFDDSAAAPRSEASVTNDSPVTANNDILPVIPNDETYPADLASEEVGRALPTLPTPPFLSSKGEGSPLATSSSGPVAYLGTFQVMSMPMPNIGDIMGFISKLPGLPNMGNLPNLGK